MVNPIPREDLIEDLQRVASKIGEPPTGTQYNEHGNHSPSTLRGEFGGIPDAREAAGLDGSDQRGGQNKPSRQELLDAIHDLHDELGQVPRREDMLEQGAFSESPYRTEFDTWGAAVVEAGYEPYRPNSELAETVTVTCEWCESSDEVLASDLINQNNWYCSHECMYDWKSENVVGEDHHQYNRVSVTCDYCGETRRRKPSIAETRNSHFCNKTCYAGWCSEQRTGDAHPRWSGGPVELECDVCGRPFAVRQAKAKTRKHCSIECMATARGEWVEADNPNWTEGTTGYYGPNWQDQREKRLARDDYSCVICGLSQEEHNTEFGQGLVVHHVTPRREFVTDGELQAEDANRVENLRTMCAIHHQDWEGIPVAPD